MKTVVFAAGNLVQILDLQTKQQTFIRSMSGGGIGAITVSMQSSFSVFWVMGVGPYDLQE